MLEVFDLQINQLIKASLEEKKYIQIYAVY